MGRAKWIGQRRDDLLYLSLDELCEKYPEYSRDTLKGKRGYWRRKVLEKVKDGIMEREQHLRQNQEPEIDANAELAIQILSYHAEEELSLREIYQHDRLRVAEIYIESDRPSFKTIYLNEALIGNEYSDIEFFLKTIDSLPTDHDLIVLSGIVQGDFKMVEKRRKGTLKPELASMDAQFSAAREVIKALCEKGPVVYNMGNDDMRICEDYTLEYFRKMFDLAKSSEGVNYFQQDKIKQHRLWQEHLSFQISHAYPYCLRAGRRLHSAEEVGVMSDGELEVEEYMMLYDTVKRLERGEDPNPDYAPYLDLACLADTDFKIVDDFNLRVKTASDENTTWVRHHFNFSTAPVYGNHMANMVEALGDMKANGHASPYMMVTEHNLEEVGVMVDGTWAISGGGFLKPELFMNAKGRKTNVPGDPAKRLATTRRRIPSPSASSHERFDDGRHTITIYNEKLLQKADSCPRTALILLTDWQIASLTARPDLLIKYLDYAQRIPEQRIGYFNGDFVQGRNYPNFPNENQELGLISMDSQIQFVKDILDEFLREGGFDRSWVTPGNHEWNSGTEKWHGYSFTQYVLDALSAKGLDAKRAEGMITAEGEKFKAWSSVDYVGDYGVYVSHLPLLKGAKGSSGLPIYQAGAHSKGVGQAKQSIDFEMYGHWHHPQYALFGDKLAVISGSLAGMSGYEWMRGYRPTISSVVLHIGGGQPPQLEFLSKEFMENWQVDGWSDEQISKFLEDNRLRASRGEYTRLR